MADQARTLAVMGVILELENAFLLLLKNKHKNPALLNIYAFIDICAALANDGKTNNQDIFKAYLDEFAMMSGKPFNSYDLWAARSSLLHSFSPLGHLTKPDEGARPIFYYAWPEQRKEMEEMLKSKNYSNFILLDVEDVKSIAIDAFSSLQKRIETDKSFETRFLSNAEDFLFDLQAFKLEAELSKFEKLGMSESRDA